MRITDGPNFNDALSIWLEAGRFNIENDKFAWKRVVRSILSRGVRPAVVCAQDEMIITIEDLTKKRSPKTRIPAASENVCDQIFFRYGSAAIADEEGGPLP